MRRRKFITGGLATAAFLATGSGAYANLVERHAVEVRRLSLHLDLPVPLRVGVLADFHFDPHYELDYHAHVLDSPSGAKNTTPASSAAATTATSTSPAASAPSVRPCASIARPRSQSSSSPSRAHTRDEFRPGKPEQKF